MPKFRSPVLGFNHNIRHNGVLFHVQSEDSGVQNPHLYTHLFHEGVIIASKKLEYDPESDNDVVKTLMQSQHKSVMKELKHGLYDEKIKRYLGVGPGAAAAPKADMRSQASEPVAVEALAAATLVDPAVISPASELMAAPVTSVDVEPVPMLVHDEEDITPLPPAVPMDAVPDESAQSSLPIDALGSALTDESAGASSPYAQLVVAEEKQNTVVSGVLESRGHDDEDDAEEDAEINGLLSRLKEDSVDQPMPQDDSDRAGTWLVSRPGQKERPFEKTGPVAVPVPIQREEVARRLVKPSHLPEVTPPPLPPGAARPRKSTHPPTGSVPSVPRRPTPPPTQVNPAGKPGSGQYSTVRPAPASRQAVPVPSSSGTNPPVGPKPPTIPPARPSSQMPALASGPHSQRTTASPPRPPISGVVPSVSKPPPIPGRSQTVPPVPPRGTGMPPVRPSAGSPSRAVHPVTTAPMRAQTVISPTGGPTRTTPVAPRPGGRLTPVSGVPVQGRRPPSEGVVVARPAVVIGAPPTVIGGPEGAPRRQHGREPTPPPFQPESIFGNDLISEKSLDEVIMAYLSEDSNED